jgi:hypothetical protein
VSRVIPSILDSVKKNLGIAADYDVYDSDILLYINGVFSTLNQLGVGPEDGFVIEDDSTEWDDFLMNDPRLNHVRTYVSLRVRMLFDPPQTSHAQEAIKEQIKEHEWRLNAQREETMWTDPTVLVP